MSNPSMQHASVIDRLRKNILDFKSELKELRSQVNFLIEDNRRLANQLEEIVREKIEGTHDNISFIEEKLEKAIITSTVEGTLTALAQDKEKPVIKSIVDSQVDAVEKRILEVRAHYNAGMTILSNELQETQNEVKRLKTELQSTDDSVNKSLVALKENRELLNNKEKIVSRLAKENSELKEQILRLESELAVSQKTIEKANQDIQELQKNYDQLSAEHVDLKNEHDIMTEKYLSLKKEAHKCLTAADDAAIQFKAMSYREQSATKTIQELRNNVHQEVQRVRLQCADEMRKVNDEHNKELQSLISEIKSLELKNSEKQALLEKIQRDNNRLESKLKAFSNKNKQDFVPSLTYYGLCERLTASEKARNNAILELKFLEDKFKDETERKSRELEFYQLEVRSANEQLLELRKILDETLAEKSDIDGEIFEEKNKNKALTKEVESLNSIRRKELSRFQETLLLKEQSFESRLQAMKENYEKKIIELENCLMTHQDINQQWKSIGGEFASFPKKNT